MGFVETVTTLYSGRVCRYIVLGRQCHSSLYDKMAVVDSRLRVRRVERVRIADTSILPKITSGNTNAPAIAIGERVAEFLTQDILSEA